MKNIYDIFGKTSVTKSTKIRNVSYSEALYLSKTAHIKYSTEINKMKLALLKKAHGEGVMDTIKSGAKAVWDFIKRVIKSIIGFFKRIWNWIIKKGKALFDSIGKLFNSIKNKLKINQMTML